MTRFRTNSRYVPWAAAIVGSILLSVLVPGFRSGQPVGLSITRQQARKIADGEASKIGIDVSRSWVTVSWDQSEHLEKELAPDPRRHLAAARDPIVGPRLHFFSVEYWRRGVEKRPEYGYVAVGIHGEVLAVRALNRGEDAVPSPPADTLRPLADAFVRQHDLPGAAHAVFESVRPTQLKQRTDYTFRYRVPSSFPLGNVVLYESVFFNGNRFAGFEPLEEYSNGSAFAYDSDSGIAGLFLSFSCILVLLGLLLVIFLKKYHAGEVGVGTGAFLFAVVIVTLVVVAFLTDAEESIGTGLGGASALETAWAFGGFKFLFLDLALAVMVFLGWSVGESYARERWGQRLASFDALLRRDPFNATVGSSLVSGVLYAPLVAAAALLLPRIGTALHFGYPTLGEYSGTILSTYGGPVSMVATAFLNSISLGVVGFLFLLSFFHRRRALWAGVISVAAFGTMLGAVAVPTRPLLPNLLLGFGGSLAAAAVFMAVDLLGATVAVFVAGLVLGFVPLMTAATGAALPPLWAGLLLPMLVLFVLGMAGMMTGREVVYQQTDLAPHVRRIVERERVKAEIDAANRIQAALLPTCAPEVVGADIASHYCSASEIGGDYFDFLQLGPGKMGLAFGDVAGHGLTSGIVMSMAKAALLVQVDYDYSPQRVMEVLNEIVIKTAPRRMMMTFFFGVLDTETLELRFSSAGHLDPYVYRSADGTLESLSVWGFPLGVRRRDPFREMTVHFEPGDRLILYSDGLIEAVDDDGHPFGFDRFERILVEQGPRDADSIKRAILSSVRKFTRNRPPEDDQTLVVVSFTGEGQLRKLA